MSGQSGDALFEGRLRVSSGGGIGHCSSSLSSEPEENVSDGVGETLRNLFGGEGNAVSPSPNTSSAWDLTAKNAVLRSVSRGLTGSSRMKARKAASVARERHPANRSRSRRVHPMRWRALANHSFMLFEPAVSSVENRRWGRG